MALESKLIKPSIVKGAELLRQAAQGPDKPELGADFVNDKTEPRHFGELETTLSLTLRFNQWVARRQKICIEVVEAVHRDG